MMNKIKIQIFLLVVACFIAGCKMPQHSGQPESEVLKDFVRNPQNAILTDFSYAGYHNGEAIPPVRKDLPYFSVLRYGAIPNDGKDDIDAIQLAIDDAAKAGGGIVSFPSGTFDFDVNTAKRFLIIRHSNIILRGNGANIEGTIFHDHTASSYPDPTKKWLAGTYPCFVYIGALPYDSTWRVSSQEGQNHLANVKAAKRHSKILEVDDASNLKPGDTYLLTQQDSDTSLVRSLANPAKKIGRNYLSMAPADVYKFQNLVTIQKITGNTIHLDAPVLWDLQANWKPKLWAIPQLITNVGIEGIRMKTDWSQPFIHHLNSVHDNGWDHIRFNFAKDCWVRNTVHDAATSAIGLGNSMNCVLVDCQITGNPGHNGFAVNGVSTRNLLTNLLGGRAMHTYTIQGYASGNVFHNCYSDEPSAIDCHGGLGVYNLFDCIYGAVFKNGGSANNVPPVMGNKLVFWNWEMGITDPYNGRMKPIVSNVEAMPGFVAVGLKGGKGQEVFFQDEKKNLIHDDYNSAWGRIEFLNEKIQPYSLYRFQQEKRLGNVIR